MKWFSWNIYCGERNGGVSCFIYLFHIVVTLFAWPTRGTQYNLHCCYPFSLSLLSVKVSNCFILYVTVNKSHP